MVAKVLFSLCLGLLLTIPAQAATVGAPSALNVPATDPDGNYLINWMASATAGASYVLEESTSPDFSVILSTYLVKVPQASIKKRPAGYAYHYRVKAVLTGYEDSEWALAAGGCDVPFIIKTKAGKGGTIEPPGPFSLPVGGSQLFAIIPEDGYHVLDVKVDGIDRGAVSAVNVPEALQGDVSKHVIKAKFAVNSYLVTAAVEGGGGTIAPAGTKSCKHGKQATYTIVPNPGWTIAGIYVNDMPGPDLPASGSYKLTLTITEETTIKVDFATGETKNYLLLEQGNQWRYLGKADDGGVGAEYYNSVAVTGTKPLLWGNATILSESNPGYLGYPEQNYLILDESQLLYAGNNDPQDLITPQVIPYKLLNFPVLIGDSFTQIDNKNLDYGEDLDGDALNEKAGVTSTVSIIGKENLTLAIGTFADCVTSRQDEQVKVTLSRNGQSAKAVAREDTWYCPDVGLAKKISQIDVAGEQFLATEELVGYRVGEEMHGLLPEFVIAEAIAPANSDTESPGRPAIGSDGVNFLVVSQSVRDAYTSNQVGMIVSRQGVVVKRFEITKGLDYGQRGSNRSEVGFDGSNYLVVFGYEGKIYGQRVTSEGLALDGEGGFRISTDNPGGATNFNPAVAFDGINYLVVWGKYDPTYICENSLCYPKGYDIYGARVTPGGQVLGEFAICTANGGQTDPAIAFGGTDYLVLWSDPRNAAAENGWAEVDLFGSRVTPNGLVLDPAGIPISTARGGQSEVRLIYGGNGFFAVWLDLRDGGDWTRGAIYGARISTDGTLLDGPSASGGIVINSAPAAKSYPSLAYDGSNYVVTWQVEGASTDVPAGLYGMRVTPLGTLVDGPPDSRGLPFGWPPQSSRYVYPVVHANGPATLLAWVNNTEVMGASKDLRGFFIYPW